MGLSDEIRKLFKAPGREDWWRDGIFSEMHWASAPRRVLFLLKEPNGTRQKYVSVVETPEEHPHSLDWDGWIENGRWAYAILNTDRNRIPDFEECCSQVEVPDAMKPVARWKIARHQAAVVNLKKEPGGSSCNYEELASWAKVNAEVLREQLELINPQIVVLCGSGVRGIAVKVFGLPSPHRLERPYFVAQNRLWIDFYHYKARYPNFLTFYAIAGITQSALQRPEVRTILQE